MSAHDRPSQDPTHGPRPPAPSRPDDGAHAGPDLTQTAAPAEGGATPRTRLEETQATGGRPLADPTGAAPPAVPGHDVLGVLGRGGMGIVYKARHRALKRLVALKMIRAGAEAGPDELARFKAEALAVARLQHPNIVQIYEVGEHNGLPYFSLEFVDGGSLSARFKGRPVPPRPAAQFVETLARAMHVAHHSGVLHRDLKPANILLATRGAGGAAAAPDLAACTPKITDFGLSKQLDDPAGPTCEGAIMGTPSYMAPEQAGGKNREVGPWTDVYALGAVLYELLTGRPPFKGESVLDTLEQVRSREPLPPRRLQAKVPRDLETICLKCLEKEPANRYAGAAELADDLARFLNFEPIRTRRAGVGERLVKWARRRPAVVLSVLLVAVLGAGAAGGYRLWQQKERRDQDAREADRRARDADRRAKERERQEAERAAREADGKALKIEHYATFVNRSGGPVGVTRLTAEQARRRAVSFRFSVRGGKVERMDVVNGHGQFTPNHGVGTALEPQAPVAGPKRECSYVFKRDENGLCYEERALNQAGGVVWRLHYTSPTTAYYIDRHGLPTARAASGAARADFTWSSPQRGFLREVRYLDVSGTPKPDRNGAFGLRLDLNGQGRPLRRTFLDAKGQPAAAHDNTAGAVVRYDQDGNVIEEAYFGADGKAVRHRDGYHSWKARYDPDGNQVEMAFFGPAGEPVRHRDGFHRWVVRRDDHGNAVATTYFGPDRKPTCHRHGNHRWVCRYDGRGNATETTYFGLDGKPTAPRDGVARWTARHDGRGLEVERAWFGVDDKPVALADGFARIGNKYDKHGNVVETTYFGTDGRPGKHRDGYHRWSGRFDDNDYLLEAAYFDAAGKPAARRDGIHRWTVQYNARGLEVERAWFGVDDKPVAAAQGFARVTKAYDAGGGVIGEKAYDASGRPLEEPYFGPEDKYVLRHDSSHRWRMKTSAKFDGSVIQLWFYYDLAGKAAVHPNGYAAVGMMRDGRGNLSHVLYLGRDLVTTDARGRPTIHFALHPNGYASWKAAYDDRGHRIEESYYGLRGEPVANRAGYARTTRAFDDQGRLAEETYWALDATGQYLRCRREPGAGGLPRAESYVTAAGKPALQQYGYHRWAARFDKRGREVGRDYFGLDGRPVRTLAGFASYTRAFDERGRITAEAYFDAAGRPARHTGGYHRWTARYDGRGREVERAWFETDGRPAALEPGGSTRVTRTYPPDGRPREETFWAVTAAGDPLRGRRRWANPTTWEIAWDTPDGKPAEHRDGYHKVVVRNGPSALPVEIRYYDPTGRPARHADGYHRATRRYDDKGHLLEEAWFGTDGKPARHKDGHARLLRGLNFTGDGRPMLHADGYHAWRERYDEHGHRIELACFGLHGEPARHKDGYHKETARYDPRGNLLDVAYFDGAGKSYLFRGSYARMSRLHDGSGNCVEESFFGTDGKPMTGDKVPARRVNVYEGGRLADSMLYDASGRRLRVAVVVQEVLTTGQARTLGLRPGDVLVSYDGKEVGTVPRFLYQRRGERPGDRPRELRVSRGGKTFTVAVAPGPFGATLRERILPPAAP